MKLFLGKKVGVSKEEKSLSYYKFFDREMAKIPEEKIALLEKPSKVEIVPFEQKNLFLETKNFQIWLQFCRKFTKRTKIIFDDERIEICQNF